MDGLIIIPESKFLAMWASLEERLLSEVRAAQAETDPMTEYSVADVCEKFDVCRSTLMNRVRANEIEYHAGIGKKYLFYHKDIIKFYRERSVKAIDSGKVLQFEKAA